jgi:hypothetical protein
VASTQKENRAIRCGYAGGRKRQGSLPQIGAREAVG